MLSYYYKAIGIVSGDFDSLDDIELKIYEKLGYKTEWLEYIITNLVDKVDFLGYADYYFEAEEFINFLSDPENAKENVEYIGYATPNTAAYALLDKETQEDEAIYPPKEVLDKCEIYKDLGNDIKLYDDVWLKVKIS